MAKNIGTNHRAPQAQGLYDPHNEKDGCGVGLVAHIDGRKSHEVVENALQVLEHMAHRGAEGADNKTGDGAGIMVQIPHEFILLQGIPVPEKGRYATGMVFMSKGRQQQELTLSIIRDQIESEGLSLTHVRNVPVNSDILGDAARATEPAIKQIFVCDTGGAAASDLESFEKRIYVARRKIEHAVMASHELHDKEQVYVVSLSTRTLIYKGMLSSMQLRYYFTDLINPYFTSGLALVHSRFSTNTFPKWHLAQPFRLLGHNGEINTIKGNRSWMITREALFNVEGFGNMQDVYPIVQPDMSDSATLDNVLEFFVVSGMSLPHALSMLVPESYNDKNPISGELKAFYEYHSIFMEPWDGPAALLFSDGRYAGGMLDRNGLRPARYFITKDNMMVVASEMGVLDIEASQVREKGRLRPGKILMIDTQTGTIQYDPEIKEALAREHPYMEWLRKNRVILSQISSGRHVVHSLPDLERQMRAFGYSREDVDRIILPMSRDAAEPIGSMGDDTPLAVLSSRPQPLFNYFRQQFAQVTNPPVDPLREELVMSISSYIGAVGGNILHPSEKHCKVVKLPSPVISNTELDILCNLRYKGFNTQSLPMLFDPSRGAEGVEAAVEELCRMAEKAVDDGINYVVLSDRGVDAEHAPIPSLLALSAVHHYLINVRKRAQIALIVETAEAREVMHIALLIGFGASAVNPYMAFAVLDDLVKRKELQLDYDTAEKRYVKAVNKGMLKIISKMGISTIRSYRGAKIFEAVGLSKAFLDKYFSGITSSIGGSDLEDITSDLLKNHSAAFAADADSETLLQPSGEYAYRKGGITHAWNPQVVAALQAATRTGDYAKFKEYTRLVDEKERPIFIRDMLEIKRNPIDISKVEPVESIMHRFATGAMSFGSINALAHEALAKAMNMIGGKSNTGEGGEDPARYKPNADGTSSRSAIKQVASARFGVNAEYLVNADEIQIKVAQGAKPGEGGQLPGFKVNEVIARTRHSLPGISLISPPPHHDIYSIEDLSQLIFDLKNVNPDARISVKLVSEGGIGTIAAGVAKAKADMILISGCDGGTGASPMSSIKHAGLPPEIGLAEVQQTLVLNNLRGKVSLQVDGQLKTGRDIIISALLGAEEYGFATSALIVLGCKMIRKCHLNTCPMGVATQNPELVKRFEGSHLHLVNFFRFLAEDVREHLAEMGFTCLDDIIGRTDLLTPRSYPATDRLSKVDLSKILYRPAESAVNAVRCCEVQDHKIDSVLDRMLISLLSPAIDSKMPAQLSFPIHNTDRSVGAMLSGYITRRYGGEGLPEDTVQITFKGSAGQSFGAFLCHGVTFRLKGDANDYLGKSLSGGRIIVTPPDGSTFRHEANIIAGNTLMYGATEGELYVNGVVGERFCVRNSGAVAVVEGVGDHCCEYMTGGRVVVLGTTGRNFAAGMSGGVAYVWNKDGDFDYYCNMELVELSLVETEADLKELHTLISAHMYYTGSQLAPETIDAWDVYSQQFIKVIPTEYKRIMAMNDF